MCYDKTMYNVGDYIDLSHINRPKAVRQTLPKSEAPTLREVGTQVIFTFAAGHIKAARRIPVVFA